MILDVQHRHFWGPLDGQAGNGHGFSIFFPDTTHLFIIVLMGETISKGLLPLTISALDKNLASVRFFK